MRLRRNKALAAATIQKIVRGRLATRRVAIMLKDRRFGQAATKIQCFIRGHLARRNMARILIELAHFKYAVRIQAVVRGAICRIHISKKIAAMQVCVALLLVLLLLWLCPCWVSRWCLHWDVFRVHMVCAAVPCKGSGRHIDTVRGTRSHPEADHVTPHFIAVGISCPPPQGGHQYPVRLSRIPLLGAVQDDDAQGQQGEEGAGPSGHGDRAHHQGLCG